jgi:hypothetical protein
MSYEGTEDATRERVRRYLKENYADTDATPLSAARLTELLADHEDTLTHGIEFLSHARFVGDQIAEAVGLEWTGDDEE